MNAFQSQQFRAFVLEGFRYEVIPGPDRGQYFVDRDGERWAFFRRGDEGGGWGTRWVEPSLVGRIMSEAR
jgi:hypothetical protein